MCTFRGHGKKFDVDGFLAKSYWTPAAIYRRGYYRRRRFPHSGFNVGVSDAHWDSLSKQTQDALIFLRHNKKEIKRLRNFPGVERLVLDFPVYCMISRRVCVQEESFSKELLGLAGNAGVDIMLSLYRNPVATRSRRKARAARHN